MQVNSAVLLIIVFLIAIIAIRLASRHRWEIKEVNLNFAGMGATNICQNKEAAQLAHRAWIELATRKAAIPYDEEDDVLVEVYDSWYQLFKALREIVQDVPTRRRWQENVDETKVINSIVGALNAGMRPHLTKWQAKFRRWYNQAIAQEDNKGRSPQEIQRDYPQYSLLIEELKTASEGLAVYSDELRKIAHPRIRKRSWSFRKSNSITNG